MINALLAIVASLIALVSLFGWSASIDLNRKLKATLKTYFERCQIFEERDVIREKQIANAQAALKWEIETRENAVHVTEYTTQTGIQFDIRVCNGRLVHIEVSGTQEQKNKINDLFYGHTGVPLELRNLH